MLIVFLLKLGTRDQSLLLHFFFFTLHCVQCSETKKKFICSLKPNSEQQSMTVVVNPITVNEDNLIEYK